MLEWTLPALLAIFYFGILITTGVVTFSKGRWALGITDIFFPALWLAGALLPAGSGSRHATGRGYGAGQDYQERQVYF